MVDINKFELWMTHDNIGAKSKAHICHLQYRDLFKSTAGIFQHCKERLNIIHGNYTRTNNKVIVYT